MTVIEYFFNFLLLFNACASCKPPQEVQDSNFVVEYEWQYLNFTWASSEDYATAIATKSYIPENVAMAGIKFYKNRIYVATPRIREGVPVTLGYISMEDSPKLNPLITPFPSWELNKQDDCSTIRNVQSMEIDATGTMWVLDGFRINDNTGDCPPKLLLIDLNNNNEITTTFVFPEEICLTKGGFLNDLVVDDSDGGFAYITDHSGVDPGLIVYSKSENRAWKLRDATVFSELNATDFVVNNLTVSKLAPIDGIALSPKRESRMVYFCALVAHNLYSISTDILKNEEVHLDGEWRKNVNYVGKKQSQSDGLVIDNTGVLYYGLLPLNGVGKWNTSQPFSTSEIVDQNNETIVWPDSFGFDDKGNLYLLANNINQFFDITYPLVITDQSKFHILKMYTGTKSYLH